MNYNPTTPLRGHKLAIILPYKDKESKYVNEPFASASGNQFRVILSQMGLPYTSCFVGYLTDKVKLAEDLTKFDPNCCLLLGEEVMQAFGQYEHSIHKFRGSLFYSPIYKVKCVATYQMGQVQRVYAWMHPFTADLNRAVSQSRIKGMPERKRTLLNMPTFGGLINLLKKTKENAKRITLDLEGHPNDVGVTCLSIAESKEHCYIVPLRNLDHSPFWSLDEETQIWFHLIAILRDNDIKKTAQNNMYELFVFAWRHKILIKGLDEDTMFQQWEMFCEQPKGLDFIASIYTLEPYYKSERTIRDIGIHHTYCCKDSLVTHEANEFMNEQMTRPESREHYRFNISLLKPYLYMTLRGCKIDKERVEQHRETTWKIVQHQQEILNEMAGRVLNTKSPKQLKEFLYEELGLPVQYKPNPMTRKKEPCTDAGALGKLIVMTDVPVILEIMKSMRIRTRFSDINKLQTFADGRIRSNYNPTGTDTGRLNSKATWIESTTRVPKISFVKDQMKLVYKNEKRLLGTNLQNQTKDLRDCFVADEGYEFYQYDLSGADAWTVAADLQRLGNDKMMLHLKAGVKPSVVITLLTEYGDAVYKWPLSELQERQKTMLAQCKSDPVLAHKYTCSKSCQHGTNYGMMPPLMSQLLLTRSLTGWVDSFNFGKTDQALELKPVHPNVMSRYQNLYTEYYGLHLRNEWIERQLCNHGYIDSASGVRRYFTELRSRHKIPQAMIRTAASHEPQANTTYATNMALAKMYYDRENRTAKGNLRCESSIMVHDALCGQVHSSQKEWAKQKLENEWFNTTLNISGIEVDIPVEGGFGPNWKSTD